MFKAALKILKEIEKHGYQAYIVGGFVRDYLLGIESNDIDITTSATPKEIKEIFADACLPQNAYGSVTIIYKHINFEITTFRREANYQDNRRPSTVIYVHQLEVDLRRRDFTINAICMDRNRNIIDPLNGREDLKLHLINTINDAQQSFQDDALRILRAIRFATILDFSLSNEVKEAILQTKYLLKNISYDRKKSELNRIFGSLNILKGIKMISDLGLEEPLELQNLSKVKPCSQIIGIWAMLNVDDIYPFSRNEKTQMEEIRKVLLEDPLNPMTLYHYGLYSCIVAGELLGISKKKVNKVYSKLAIHKRSDLKITTDDILKTLEIEAGPVLNQLYKELETLVVLNKISNTKNNLIRACKIIYDKITKGEK